MTGRDIILKVSALDLPAGSYVVFGSGTLALLGIRKTQDIDLLISNETHDRLVARGWKSEARPNDDRCLTQDVFDAHTNWHIGDYDPKLQDLLQSAIVVDGIPFAALEEVKKWKSIKNRPKDIADIALIDAYIRRQTEKPYV